MLTYSILLNQEMTRARQEVDFCATSVSTKRKKPEYTPFSRECHEVSDFRTKETATDGNRFF